jgi:hypothetical protein
MYLLSAASRVFAPSRMLVHVPRIIYSVLMPPRSTPTSGPAPASASLKKGGLMRQAGAWFRDFGSAVPKLA